MQQRSAEPYAPQRRRPDLGGLGRGLDDAVASADVVEQQIGKERHDLTMEPRVRVRSGLQRRHVARRATDAREDALTGRSHLIQRLRSDRGQEPHEAGEVVDPSATGPRVGDVFGIGNGIAEAHARSVHAHRDFSRKEIVRDAHLIAIGVGAERQQCGVLGLPTESADAPFARSSIGHDRRPAGHTVAPAVLEVRQRHQGVIVDGLDEACAEQRDGYPPGDDICIRWDRWLTCVTRNREEMEQRFPGRRDRDERTVEQATPGANLCDRADTAHRRDVVTGGTTGAVERRPQPFLRGLDFEEVVQAKTELLELRRREPGQRVTGLDLTALPEDEGRGQPQHRRGGERRTRE